MGGWAARRTMLREIPRGGYPRQRCMVPLREALSRPTVTFKRAEGGAVLPSLRKRPPP